MKRRIFGLMAGTSIMALSSPGKPSFADTQGPSLLKLSLTPMGSERAGNSAGTIPAWTGGLTAIPAGFDWDPDKTLPPDFFASDTLLYEVNSSNIAQYTDLLSEGVQTLISKENFYLKVYPTRRTHALPQWVYNNIALNVTRATPQDGDARLGFNDAVGGYPFPIPSVDPYQAGAQIIWNSQAYWHGSYQHLTDCLYTNADGIATLASAQKIVYRNDFYLPGVSIKSNPAFYTVSLVQIAPPILVGGRAIGVSSSNPIKRPQTSWALLLGQGRVRRTPNLMYDTPSSYDDGILNFDEQNGFNGPMDRYDWKSLGKKEMLIPYNNNKQFSGTGPALHKTGFFDPEYVRWELHRVWVVEATLHPGKRNVLARRIFYVDEDTWAIGVTDAWDGGGNIVRMQYTLNANFPNLPGTIYSNGIAYNLQTGQYVSSGGSFADAPYNDPWKFTPAPGSFFDPQAMAAWASY